MEHTKKIVMVVFDDGTQMSVSDHDALMRFLQSERHREAIRALAADTSIDWNAVGILNDYDQSVRLAKKKKKRADAAKPRKDVTKKQLLSFKSKFEAQEGRERGWKAEASREFGIDTKTIGKRIKE